MSLVDFPSYNQVSLYKIQFKRQYQLIQKTVFANFQLLSLILLFNIFHIKLKKVTKSCSNLKELVMRNKRFWNKRMRSQCLHIYLEFSSLSWAYFKSWQLSSIFYVTLYPIFGSFTMFNLVYCKILKRFTF